MSVDDDLSHSSLLDLFREEAQTQTQVLGSGLLTLENAPTDAAALEACMRAAHSLKGAARIIDLQAGVDIAHAMEECFVAAQRGTLLLSAAHIDQLLHGVDLLLRAGDAHAPAVARHEIDELTSRLCRTGEMPGSAAITPDTALALDTPTHVPERAAPTATSSPGPGAARHDPQRMLRVRATQLDRLLSLAGESLVESSWPKSFSGAMQRMRRAHRAACRVLDARIDALTGKADAAALAALHDVRAAFEEIHVQISERIDEIDRFDHRNTHIAQQMYEESLHCRMLPFGDSTQAYPRIVRDLARSLGKKVRFSIVGETTQIDRDILDMIDAPLGHLLRNALDHGVETPEQRIAAGKPPEATVTVEARHSAGKLLISVDDDGAGIDLEALRATIARRGLTDADTARRLSDHELLDFLLLPGFSMRERVTDMSGRGVGLDAVREMASAVGGTVRVFTELGKGTRFVLQLPLTLSVIRSLLADVGGEIYAFPLSHIRCTLSLARADIDMLEGQQHFRFAGKPVGLVAARQLLGAGTGSSANEQIAVVVIGDDAETYGVAVDKFLGESMLVVQPLDSRLGKIKDISAGAIMESGEPALIVDIEDLLRSVSKLVRGGQLERVQRTQPNAAARRKHVLVVEDSLTVRELERKLLEKSGYAVTVAVDGMDGWNILRGAAFDLVVTDIDMPRMDGIELVSLIKHDAILKKLPVMIVSYKDRDEDRNRGLDAGADYYLVKGSFHDDVLINAVRDLIGESGS
ncbi:MAG: hybrid sensor histidine kinase/response regulator [Bordetella sp.]|uniref:hybrid sensor histidine kinase/response regulator n=1 Tax=Bordetella sp. TaxID=28081 RepID=UPI003F7CBD8F